MRIMFIKKLWKPKNSRMISLESFDLSQTNLIELKVKINESIKREKLNMNQLLLLFRNRYTKQEVKAEPKEIQENDNIVITYIMNKENFREFGYWDAFVVSKKKEYRIHDAITSKYELNSYLDRIRQQEITFYSTIKENLSIRISKLEFNFQINKVAFKSNNSILLFEGLIKNIELEQINELNIILTSENRTLFNKKVTMTKIEEVNKFEIELNLEEIKNSMKTPKKISFYAEVLMKSEKQTVLITMDSNTILPNKTVYFENNIISFDLIERELNNNDFFLRIVEVKDHYELESVYFKDGFLRLAGELTSNSVEFSINNVLFINRSTKEIVEVPINRETLHIDLASLIKTSKLSVGIWDIFVATNVDNFRVAKRLDDIINKQSIVSLPQSMVEDESDELLSVKPYYTLSNELSLLIRKVATQKAIQSYMIDHNNLLIKGLLHFNRPSDGQVFDDQYPASLFIKFPYKQERVQLKGHVKLSEKSRASTDYLLEFRSEEVPLETLKEMMANIHFDLVKLKISFNDFFIDVQLNIDPQKEVFSMEDKIRAGNSVFSKLLNNKFIYKIFNKILPINKRAIVFQSFHGKSYSCNPRAIYEEMIQSEGDKYKYIWVLNNRRQEITSNKNTIIVKPGSLMYFYHLARSKYFINNGNFPDVYTKKKGTYHIQTWHGTPLKKLGFDISPNSPSYKENTSNDLMKRNSRWDLAISPNTFTSEVYKSAFKYKNKIIESGYPRNDIFYQENNKKIIDIKSKLGIKSNKKVILYAPTWRDYDFHNNKQTEPFQFKFDIERFIENFGDEYVLLIRLHYRDALRAQISKYEGLVINVSNYDDIKYLYLISDILITDYSSVMFDFANSNKPIIFFAYDIVRYSSDLRGFYFNFRENAPGPIVTTEQELFKAIHNIKQIEFLYKDIYDQFKNKYCNFDNGNSSKLVIEEVFRRSEK